MVCVCSKEKFIFSSLKVQIEKKKKRGFFSFWVEGIIMPTTVHIHTFQWDHTCSFLPLIFFFSLKRFENEILRRTYKNVVLILKLDNVDFKDYQDTQRNMIVKNYSIFEDLQNLLGQKLIFWTKIRFWSGYFMPYQKVSRTRMLVNCLSK